MTKLDVLLMLYHNEKYLSSACQKVGSHQLQTITLQKATASMPLLEFPFHYIKKVLTSLGLIYAIILTRE